MYDNPENLGQTEILEKIRSIGHGPNRDRRVRLLFSYSTESIPPAEWIRKYCKP